MKANHKTRKAEKKSIERIVEIKDNEGALNRLIKELKESVVVPFVGAGLSIPFGYPGWANFILERAEIVGVGEEVRAAVAEGDFEQATDVLLKKVGPNGLEFGIQNDFGPARVPESLFGAVTCLPKLSKGPVVTTNFDRVLERAFEEQGKAFEKDKIFTGTEAEKAIRAARKRERFLIKIHGDVDFKTGRILARTVYDEWYGPRGNVDMEKPLPQLFSQILTNRSLLFLGCSLTTDRTLEVLKKLAVALQSPHFAILEEPEDTKSKNHKTFFAQDHNILPIWYPHEEHEYVDIILQHLVKEVSGRGGGVVVPLIYAALLAAVGLGMFAQIPSATSHHKEPIKVGIVQPRHVSHHRVTEEFVRLFKEFNAIQEGLKEVPSADSESVSAGYRIEESLPPTRIYTEKQVLKEGGAIDDLNDGTIDMLGVISPYQIHNASKKVEPIISPRYGNSSTYEAVFFVSNKWLEDLRDEGEPTAAETREIEDALKEDAGSRKEIDYRIRPALWRRMISNAKSEDCKIRLMAGDSASGYWYPRQLALGALGSKHKWSDVIERPDNQSEKDLVESVRDNEEKACAGALATFRLERPKGMPGEVVKDIPKWVTVVHRMPTIPQGGFVVSQKLAKDRRLIEVLKESWGNAALNVYDVAANADSAIGGELKVAMEQCGLRLSNSPYADLREVIEKINRTLERADADVFRRLLEDNEEFKEFSRLAEIDPDDRSNAQDEKLRELFDEVNGNFPTAVKQLSKFYTKGWNPVNLVHYEPAFAVFNTKDPAARSSTSIATDFLAVGGALIALVATTALWQRRRGLKPGV